MSDLVVESINATYDRVGCSEAIARELYDLLTYQYPNYENLRWKVKRFRGWDGLCHLFTLKGHKIYRGLRSELQKIAKDLNYSIEFTDGWGDDEFSLYEANNFISQLRLPFKPHNYQIKAFVQAIRKKRLLILSPTSSGKSLMIYLIHRYWNEKTLFITPTVNLVNQVITHFGEYGYQDHIHPIYAGQPKQSDNLLSASTWQSLPVDSAYLNQYKAIIVDECLFPNTLITTDNGHKNICDIKEGEMVLSINEKTKQFEFKEVVEIHKNLSSNEQFYEILFENEKKLRISGNHKVLTKNGWIRVDMLSEGDEIKNV